MVELTDLTFRATNDADLPALLARPENPNGAGVVLIHEVFGLDPHIRAVAERLAGEGYTVLAPDLYGREGLPGPEPTEDDPVPMWELDVIRAAVGVLPDRRVASDLEYALGALVEQAGCDEERLGSLGFCMGGLYSYLLGCQSRRLACAVDYYGRVVYSELSSNKPVQPLEMALNLSCPLLAHFGEEDTSIPREHVESLRRTLSQFAREFDIVTHPGAGHGFFNDTRGAFHPGAAEASWQRTLAFFAEHLLHPSD